VRLRRDQQAFGPHAAAGAGSGRHRVADGGLHARVHHETAVVARESEPDDPPGGPLDRRIQADDVRDGRERRGETVPAGCGEQVGRDGLRCEEGAQAQEIGGRWVGVLEVGGGHEDAEVNALPSAASHAYPASVSR
jgi:hypothetical protein